MTQIAAGPAQWEDRAGNWREFDLTLRPGDWEWVARAGRATVTLPDIIGAGDTAMTLADGAGEELRMQFLGAASRAQVSGSKAIYRNVARGVDLKLQVVPEGVKEDLVLHDRRADRVLRYRIASERPGLQLREGRGGELVLSRDGRRLFVIPAPVMIDAAGASSRGQFEVRERLGGWEIGLALDDGWLDAPQRAFPVAVDPTANVLTHDAVDDCQMVWETWTPRLTTTCNSGTERHVGQLHDPRIGTQTGMQKLWFGPSLTFVPTDAIERATLKLHRLDSDLGTHANPANGYLSHDVFVVPSAIASWPEDMFFHDGARGTPIASGTPGLVESDLTELAQRWQLNELSGGVDGIANEGVALAHHDDVFDFGMCFDPVEVCDWTRFASAQHADPAKRPVLEVRSWPMAPAGAAVISPRTGDLTGRFVKLQARALHSSVSGVQFQYIAGSGRRWQDVPVAALRTTTREPVASGTIPVTGPTGDRRSEMVVWDLAATPNGDIDGPVHVRAYLESPLFGHGGMTSEVSFRLDRTGIAKTATTEIGPGDLDLVSGEFSLAETDVTYAAFLQDLTLTRTYASRGVARRNYDMFGPGWEANVNPDGGELPYKNIYNFSRIENEVVERQEFQLREFDWENFLVGFVECVILAEDQIAMDACLAMRGTFDYSVETLRDVRRWEYRYAALELGDGRKTTFTQTVAPNGQVSGWEPAADMPGYRLEYAATGTAGIFEFVLTEPTGGVARFRSEIRNSPNHRIQSYQQSGSTSALSYSYEASGNRQRLKRVTAPVPTGGTPRWMEFGWSDLGGGTWRVTSVGVGSGRNAPAVMAQYAYNDRKRLARVWSPRIIPNLVTEYVYDTRGLLSEVRPPGEEEWRLAYTEIAGDTGPRLASISRDHPDGGTATNTVRYRVPLSGPGAPYDMSPEETARWGQVDDLPWEAVAIFPADDLPGAANPDYSRATIQYLNLDGRAVNIAEPGGHISTVEHDANGNVIRQLTPANRARALAAGATSAMVANDLSTVNVYSPDGVDLVASYEPKTEIELASGTVVTGRRVTTTHYDQGAPAGGPYHLPTSRWRAVEISPGNRADQRELVRHAYSASAGWMTGWRARIPTKTTVDPAGRRLVAQTLLHRDYPLVEERRTPRGEAGGNRPEVRYYGYRGIVASRPAASSAAPNWPCTAPEGFLCAEGDGTNPPAGKLPRVWTYNSLGLVTEVAEYTSTSGPARRKRWWRNVYDSAGRFEIRETFDETSSGTPVPTMTVSYSATTGREVRVSALSGGTIERTYDSNGRVGQYIDATGLVTRSTYDLRGRPVRTVEDGTRTATYAYDDRDQVVGVTDPDVGAAITARYDADGALVSESLPNGLDALMAYDVTGRVRATRWEKTTGCSRDCVWVRSDVTARDAAGRITGHRSTRARQSYAYDSVGRLERADETELDGSLCVRNMYAYDVETNRTRRDVTTSPLGSSCGAGTTASRTWTHDNANRITNAGWVHDLHGRATTVPSPDSGGRGVLIATYYADDLIRELSLDGRSHTYERDPLRRTATVTSTGGPMIALTSTNRYADDSDTPVVTTRSDGTSVRDIAGPSGQLVATKEGTTLTYQLRDVHGSIVATAPAAGTPTTRTDYDEFGNATSSAPNVVDWTKGVAGYGWLGAHQRSTEFEQFEGAGPPIEMGVRVYLPAVGRFLQVDPVEGGSANEYEYAMQDPMNNLDLTGAITIDARAWGERFKQRAKEIAEDVGGWIGVANERADSLIGSCVKGSTIGAVAAFGDAVLKYRHEANIYLNGRSVATPARWKRARRIFEQGLRAAAKSGPFGLLAACFGGQI